MTTPRVSILLPVHNEADLLPTALKSIRRQTLTDWELVAVDDGSTDATAALLDDAARQDDRIHVLHRPKEGLIKALNRGLDACRAPLVARMDGDDVCHPERLKQQVSFMESHPDVTLVACCVRHIPRSAIRGGFLAYEEWQNSLLDHKTIQHDLFVESPFAHPSVMFRKEVVRSLGGYRDMGWAEDYDLWLRLAQNDAHFAKLPETLLFWRDRPNRLSRTDQLYTLDAFRRCKAEFLTQGFLDGCKEVILWGAGQEGKAWRLILDQHDIKVTSWIEIDPRKVGQVIHDAPVLSHEELSPEMPKILVTIGAKGARQQVRDFAASKGLIDGEHFICVT